MNMIKKLWNDESGASAAEYALILAIVGSAIALAAFNLGGAIADEMNEAATCIDSAVGSSTPGTGC
jgi:pilus assembly protein Flp/PilA